MNDNARVSFFFLPTVLFVTVCLLATKSAGAADGIDNFRKLHAYCSTYSASEI